ncbi:hypothetical protein [Nocardioides speluncae]|nr:hypothetical protein [Nocardioides speluncae]
MSLSEVMDQLDDREARCDLAHFLAAWFEKSDPDGLEQALAAWEADR